MAVAQRLAQSTEHRVSEAFHCGRQCERIELAQFREVRQIVPPNVMTQFDQHACVIDENVS